MHALLELDCIPSGMELFPAANESQWSLIKRVIEDCDYYVLILAGRYGSCGPDGISYTEMEYRHALALGKPTIAFLHKDPGIIQANKYARLRRTERTNWLHFAPPWRRSSANTGHRLLNLAPLLAEA